MVARRLFISVALTASMAVAAADVGFRYEYEYPWPDQDWYPNVGGIDPWLDFSPASDIPTQQGSDYGLSYDPAGVGFGQGPPRSRTRSLHTKYEFFYGSVSASSPSTPVGGSEYWVDGPDNVQPGSDRSASDVGLDPDGIAVHVWMAFTGNRHDVFMRRFNPEGAPLGIPQRVNTLLADDQFFPRVAIRADGSFYTVWQSDEFDPEQGTNRHWVRGQLFDSDGAPQNSELLISQVSSGTSTDIKASVTALENDEFIVTWESFNGFGSDSQPCSPTVSPGCDSLSVQARRISSTGAAIGDQFQINEVVDRSQSHPTPVGMSDGGFVVFWESFSSDDGDPSSGSIQGRKFAASGSPVGPDFQVNSITAGSQDSPEAASDDSGRILVAFETPSASGSQTSVRARLYDRNLNPLGQDFPVPTLTDPDSDQYAPRVAGGVGYFFIAWTAYDGIGTDPDFAINGRVIRDVTRLDIAQFQVNLFEDGSQTQQAVGALGPDAVVSWRSNPTNSFEQDDGIIARRYIPDQIFVTGFE